MGLRNIPHFVELVGKNLPDLCYLGKEDGLHIFKFRSNYSYQSLNAFSMFSCGN